MEAELVEELPEGDWHYEPKWDGFRGVLENETAASWRSGAGMAGRCFDTSRTRRAARCCSRPTPHSTARSSSRKRAGSSSTRCRCGSTCREPRPQTFRGDTRPVRGLRHPALEGRATHKLPLEKRRKELERKAKRFTISPYTADKKDAERWLDRLEAAGLDGVVAKRKGLPYLPGSREGVVKVKKYKTADCVIVGFRWSEKAEGRISTLLLGLYGKNGEIDFVGHTSGFPAAVRRELRCSRRCRRPARSATPASRVARAAGRKGRSSTGTRCGPSSSARFATTSSRRTASGTDPLPPLSPRQGSGAVHVARGWRPPRRRVTRPSSRYWRSSRRRSKRDGRPAQGATPAVGSPT